MTKRIFVLCGDQYHPAADVLAGLSASGGADYEFTQGPNGPITELDSSFDALAIAKLNVTSPTDETPWADPPSDRLVADFVASGKGILIVHAGTVRYQTAPRIRELTGGEFIQHPNACLVRYTGQDGQPDFEVHDEHYFVKVDADVEVFLNSTSAHGTQPAGWSKTYGDGKVQVLTAAHFGAVWAHSGFQHLVRLSLDSITRS